MPHRDFQRTTISLPAALLAEIDRLIHTGLAESRHQLIAAAVQSELGRRQREAIDREFSAMATDVDYQAAIYELMRGFASADRDAWRALATEDAKRSAVTSTMPAWNLLRVRARGALGRW